MFKRRDLFEVEYIAKHLADMTYREAKAALENLRNGDSYDDDHVAKTYKLWQEGLSGK